MLFSFGTLMDRDLLQLVVDQPLSHLHIETAYVQDKLPHWVVDDDYPVLAPAVGEVTEGIIIHNLTDNDLSRIVFFEGEEFELGLIDVQNSVGDVVTASYFKDTEMKTVSDRPWYLSEWQATTKPDTLKRTQRYMSYFGKLSAAAADAYW